MASKIRSGIGNFSWPQLEKLRELFNGDKGRGGIVVTANINVPDWNAIPVFIESDRFFDTFKMRDAFRDIVVRELVGRL